MRSQATNLSDLSGLSHGFFTREGGVSSGIYASLNCGPGSRDEPLCVVENRQRVAAELASKDTPLCTLYQIHSADVVTLTEPWEQGSAPQADALVTCKRGIVIGVLTADCTPLLFADVDAGVIGCAHAGWKGALGGIIENTVTAMEALGASRANIAAAIGPCIAQDSYEVGAEFREHFLEQHAPHSQFFLAGAPDKYWFDLPAYVHRRCEEAQLGSLTIIGHDTYMMEDHYFSFRRTTHAGESDYGRQISAIMLHAEN